MQIWDDANLRAIGAKKRTNEYVITVKSPIVVKIDGNDQEKLYAFRSVLIRNGIEFKIEEIESLN